MTDDPPDRRTGLVGFSQDFLLIVPKNTQAEVRVSAKKEVVRGKKEFREFIDFRHWWYQYGPDGQKPLPSKKGASIPRQHIGRLIEALMKEVRFGELTPERLASIRSELDRLDGEPEAEE